MDGIAPVLGHFLASFAGALIAAGIWLAVCRFIPALRRRPVASYRIATVLAFAPILVSATSPRYIDLIACLLGAALIYWYAKRASTTSGTDEPHASA